VFALGCVVHEMMTRWESDPDYENFLYEESPRVEIEGSGKAAVTRVLKFGYGDKQVACYSGPLGVAMKMARQKDFGRRMDAKTLKGLVEKGWSMVRRQVGEEALPEWVFQPWARGCDFKGQWNDYEFEESDEGEDEDEDEEEDGEEDENENEH